MKKKSFLNRRVLPAFFLFVAVLLTLIAFGAQPRSSQNNSQTANQPTWLGRLASTLGIHLESEKPSVVSATQPPRGGGAPRTIGEQTQSPNATAGPGQTASAAAPQNLKGVSAVHS